MSKHISPVPAFRHFLRWTLLVFSFAACLPLAAQQADQSSSGELKDFRLDNPPPKEKEPEVKAEPKIDLPAAQPQNETQPPPKPIPERQLAPKGTARPEPQRRDADVEPTKAAEPSLPATTTLPTSPIPDVDIGSDAMTTAPEPVATAKTGYARYWPLGLAILAGLIGLILALLWRRRKARAIDEAEVAPAEETQTDPVVPEAAIGSEPVATTAPAAAPAPSKPQKAAGSLSVTFEPDNARLSIANLTVTGRLVLRYDSQVPLETLRLRTLMISAHDGQKAMIDSFHSDPHAGQVNSLGPVQPGEEIKMKLELQLPRDALQAFDWRERRFVAPIVLINIAGDEEQVAPVRISSLVGQAGEAGSVRLQPIPVDRGPKLFDALQFRPIAA